VGERERGSRDKSSNNNSDSSNNNKNNKYLTRYEITKRRIK